MSPHKAKDPLLLGIGMAVARDLGTFLKTPQSPTVHGPRVKTLIMGTSQSGRFIRTMLLLGFNQNETGSGKAFGAALPHIGGGLLGLNIRFAAPGRGWNDQIDHLYPAYEFPFSYAKQTDPLTGRTAGVLDRCTATNTCPPIVHAATVLEVWEGRQSLGFTDPLGIKDVADLPNVRIYIMASTQHAPAPLPLPTPNLDHARAAGQSHGLGEGRRCAPALANPHHRRRHAGRTRRRPLSVHPRERQRRGRAPRSKVPRRA